MVSNLSAIKRIENRAKQIPGAISLAQGIPSFSSHPIIQDFVIKAIKDNKIDKYSSVSGLLELRQLFAQKLIQKEMFYDPDTEIIVTAGAIEGLSATLLALVKPGEEIITLTPAYPYYSRIISMARAKPISCPLSEKNGWKLDIDVLKKKLTKRTKVIIICSPNNPTGTILSKKDLITLAILAQRHKFLLILDDIYENFYYGEEPLFNLCTQKHFKKQIIRIVSLSKDFALSGWRIGLLHGDKEYINNIIPIHDNLINCAPVVSQYAALAAIRNENKIIPNYITEYKKRRQIMGEYLEQCKDFLSFIWPEGAYYFFPKIHDVRDTESFCFDMLEKAKVATVPGDEFGLGGQGHIRLCFGKQEEDIKEGMRRLINYFNNFQIKKQNLG